LYGNTGQWEAFGIFWAAKIIRRDRGSQKNIREKRGKAVAKTQSKKAANVKMPDKITGSSMVGYLAEKSGLARKDVKQVVEHLFELIASGVMRGERVAIGKMGKAFIRIRPARKARQGINPLTKEPITIAAKPATKVPRFTFSKVFKEAALKARLKG
jgi:DNA-binding protein HU-beta